MYLIVGASSFIGKHLYDYCKKNGIDVLGTYYAHGYNSEWIKFDMCVNDLHDICQYYVAEKTLDAVIVCGANASIDSCKRDSDASNALNVLGTKNLLATAGEMGVKSVFLSSEAVFDGERGMYTEEDIPNPITLYGTQKWEVEQFIRQNLNNYLIFRISRAVGCNCKENDIFSEFYDKIIRRQDIICLKEQSFCLTQVDDIAEVIMKALRRNISGLYHLSSANYISRYELAKMFADQIFGGYGKISEREYEDIPFVDNRHVHGGLCGDRLAGLLDFHYMDMTQILDRYKSTLSY